MVRFWAAATIRVATTPSRSRSTARDTLPPPPGSGPPSEPREAHRSQGRVEAGEALPEEATSLGGSRVQAARLSTWWKRPGGPLALTARLSHLQPQTFRQICSPEKGPRYPGSSRRLRSFNQFGRSAFKAYGKVPHVCSPKLTQAVCS